MDWQRASIVAAWSGVALGAVSIFLQERRFAEEKKTARVVVVRHDFPDEETARAFVERIIE